ncbi:fibropellin-1-like [Ruditapes philippinarum]|uniref:fibropellin-1-like n=1 Tax=Ruditapes philippinarum TaxID=129788 RepID=UPI00295B455C|nr:fibropellin-1-like [Ruditapes philippinarum]
MFETRWIYIILSTFMSSYGDAVGQERFILTEDQKYTNSSPSVFSGNLIPKLLLCQVNKPCRFVLPIDGRQDQMPFVQNGHRDPGLNVEPIQVWHKLPYRCYQNQKTCPYEAMVTVIPQEEKPYQYCIQTTQKDIVNVDELCFVVQGIRDNFMNVTQHFNYPPTFPINSTVKCPNNVTCHYTVEFKRHGGYCNRPSEQFLSDVTIYINETEVKQSACKYDVAITPSANARGNKTVCVSINAIASVVEAHFVNIEVTSESRQELAGPCSRRYCQTGSVCDAVDGSSKCLCPIGYTGTACEKPMQCYQSFPNSITCSGTNCHLTGIIIGTEHFVSDGNIVNITPDVLNANVKIVDILARGDASKICYHVNQPNCKKEGCVLAKQYYQNLSPTPIPGGFSANNLTYACNTDKICYVTIGTYLTNNNTCTNVTVHPNTTINHHRIFHPPTLTQTECVTSILVIGTSKAGEKQQLCLNTGYDVKCISIEVKDFEVCATNPCNNGGVCEATSNGYNCTCLPGWTGTNCTTNIDECSSNPCRYGECHDEVNNYRCTCYPGFTGLNCGTDIDECSSSPCANGVCVDGINNFTCNCDPGYTGSQCRTNINECSSSPCVHGLCEDGVNNYTCLCDAGFTGRDCRTDIDECLSNPCQNRAVCFDGVNKVFCRCDKGYTGHFCETDIDECSSNPCMNGAICSDLVNDFNCSCKEGYSGRFCETSLYHCYPGMRCLNGGTCFQGNCQCHAGFTGQLCETYIDPCVPSPCLHGQCYKHITNFFCDCQAGYTGTICDSAIDKCGTNPCINGGSCVNAINSFTCNCPIGFTGVTCQTDIDNCRSNPCLHGGNCIDGINNFTCQCQYGYSGYLCETITDFCLTNPCVRGTCFSHATDYHCTCPTGYTGITCNKTVLTINGPDRVSISVSGGSNVLLNCSATGSPATYYWTRLDGCGGISVSTGESDLVIHNASRADGGIYNCTASNRIDPNVTKTFQLTVNTSLNEKCTFEGNDKCSWKQLNNDKFDWTHQNGPTQSSQTGPDSDHTLGNEKGAYLYIEASSPRLQGDYASMVSQVLPANRTVCFKFWYYMYGDGIGHLTVNLKDMCTQKETPLFRQLGDQGQKWIQSSITIPGQRVQHDYNLILTGDIGPTYHGDIAIDDLSITDGVCTSDQMAAPGVALVG